MTLPRFDNAPPRLKLSAEQRIQKKARLTDAQATLRHIKDCLAFGPSGGYTIVDQRHQEDYVRDLMRELGELA